MTRQSPRHVLVAILVQGIAVAGGLGACALAAALCPVLVWIRQDALDVRAFRRARHRRACARAALGHLLPAGPPQPGARLPPAKPELPRAEHLLRSTRGADCRSVCRG